MTAELTIYRCYWPKAYKYLKEFHLDNFKTEAFGLLMTIDIEEKQAKRIANILPYGAVIDLLHLEDLNPANNYDFDDLSFTDQQSQPKLDKN